LQTSQDGFVEGKKSLKMSKYFTSQDGSVEGKKSPNM
jgi:hypothetical protein